MYSTQHNYGVELSNITKTKVLKPELTVRFYGGGATYLV